MNLRSLVAAWSFGLLALTGCHKLSIPNDQLKCGPGNTCPASYSCVNGTCHKADGKGDGGAPPKDGSVDNRVDSAVLPDGPAAETGGINCVSDSACLPTNPCHTGKTACSAAGVATCVDTIMFQADGTGCGDGMVCHAGACAACADGTPCDLATDPCHTGVTSCATGVAACMQSGNAPEGKGCGANMVCAAGACVACVSNAMCVPANACHAGKLDCSTGTPTCTDTGTAAAEGTSCGTDMVCGGGTCAACKVGGTCAVANPCRVGMTTCNTGKPLCAESGNVTDGTACGTAKVCSGGACIACTAGTTCTPTASPCHTGTISCAGGSATCTDSGASMTNGTSCGTDLVCSSGACVACAAGKSCTPSGSVCKVGTTACGSGSSVCQTTGNLPDGTGCGSGMVCSAGTCVACAGGSSCKPPVAPCHNGTLACGTGAPVCTDQATNLTNGTTCGSNLYCFNGGCNACTVGPCTPSGNVCLTGTTSCATGTSVCASTGNVANGTSCGTGMVCSSGTCVPCANGSSCKPSSVCHNGTLACGTGAPVCTDLGTNMTNGASCGTNFYCFNGACNGCTPGQSCSPGGNVCQTGTNSCTTGTPVCTSTGNVSNGTGCGTNMYCLAGSCSACTPNVACNPGGNVCQTGTTSCATGASVCNSTGNVGNGTSCGTGKICTNGACVARPNGASCGGGTDCGSGNCVDGVCCSTSSCAACNHCNLNGVGTCSAAPKGADALCPIDGTKCSAGCDGFGKCAPASTSTDCKPSTCSGSDSLAYGGGTVSQVGLYTSVTFQAWKCDGVTVSAAGCKAATATACNNFICASTTACKTACSFDADCLSGFGCVGGTCVAKKGDGVNCAQASECNSGICSLDVNSNGPACRGCPGRNNGCPQQTPGCGDNYECAYSCGAIRDPSGCVGTAFNCNVEPYVPTTATDCNTATGLFHCGGVTGCPPWMVCSASTCKVAGGRPCQRASDCYSNSCSNGVCSSTANGGLCIGSFANECATSPCNLKAVGAQYLSVCMP